MYKRQRAFLLDGGLEWLHAGGVAAIEWGSRVEELLPEPRWSIRFEHRGASSRAIELACVGTEVAIAAARARVEALSAHPELEVLA